MAKKFKPHERKSIIQKTLEKKKSIASIDADETFHVNFGQLDQTQGNTLDGWDGTHNLAHAIEVLCGYCKRPLIGQFSKKFTNYGDFPEKARKNYFPPIHVPEDANWARIHVTGSQCIIGHFIRNIFFIVFLSDDHDFWPIN